MHFYKRKTLANHSVILRHLHFTPKQINVTLKQLKQLGYDYDVNNIALTSTDQLIELKIQDVILPINCIKLLFNVSYCFQ